MDRAIEELEKKAEDLFRLYRNEMEHGSAGWAMRYEYMWHGVLSAVDIVKKRQEKSKKVPV